MLRNSRCRWLSTWACMTSLDDCEWKAVNEIWHQESWSRARASPQAGAELSGWLYCVECGFSYGLLRFAARRGTKSSLHHLNPRPSPAGYENSLYHHQLDTRTPCPCELLSRLSWIPAVSLSPPRANRIGNEKAANYTSSRRVIWFCSIAGNLEYFSEFTTDLPMGGLTSSEPAEVSQVRESSGGADPKGSASSTSAAAVASVGGGSGSALPLKHHSWADFDGSAPQSSRADLLAQLPELQRAEGALLQKHLIASAQGSGSDASSAVAEGGRDHADQKNYVAEIQHGAIPVYDVAADGGADFLHDEDAQKFVYDRFFHGAGCLIVRNAYAPGTMERYNRWCETFLFERNGVNNDPNCRHPKQKGKFLINQIMERMAEDEELGGAQLLMDLLANRYYTKFADVLLGFMKFGAATAHWIEPGAERQLSHVDYPLHVGSGPFWQGSVGRMQQFTTRDQVNQILPYFSVQILIASDAMNAVNGSTEVVPCSHRLSDIDAALHDPCVYSTLEDKFVNVDLQQGDFLIFCRRLCHRGGRNTSDFRRNSLITQCVWMWGICQEAMASEAILARLARQNDCSRGGAANGVDDTQTAGDGPGNAGRDVKEAASTGAADCGHVQLSPEEFELFRLRLCPPYPTDTRKAT